MVKIDIDMPRKCEECDFIAFFGGDECGCVLTVDADNSETGMKMIPDVHKRADFCLLKEDSHE